MSGGGERRGEGREKFRRKVSWQQPELAHLANDLRLGAYQRQIRLLVEVATLQGGG